MDRMAAADASVAPMFQTVKSHIHANRLVASVSSLFDHREQFSDLTIKVGDQSFRCNKLLLAISSSYFQQVLFCRHQSLVGSDVSDEEEEEDEYDVTENVEEIRLDDVCKPETFENVLRYVYRGEITIGTRTVGDVLRAAGKLEMDEMKEICAEFMVGTLTAGNCVGYLQVAEEVHHDGLSLACRRMFANQFRRIASTPSSLQLIDEDLLRAAIESDQLSIDNEVELCEILLRWYDAVKKPDTTLSRLLQCVRWSAVPGDYVGKLLESDQLADDYEGRDFLTRVQTYKSTGNRQFDGLLTFHRPSTGVELTAVLIGIDDGNQATADCWRVSLQRRDLPVDAAAMKPIPTEQMHREPAACTDGSAIYVTGLGTSCRATWRWDSVGGWVRCTDMISGRRAHCLTFISDQTTIYAIGGLDSSTDNVRASVEAFQTATNKWSKAGRLRYAVKTSTAVAYGTSIYVFGGITRDRSNNDANLECVQVFDTATRQCSEMKAPMPEGHQLRLLKAVVWDASIILVGSRTCLIYDVERQTWQRRTDFAVGVSYFGIALENQTLFVFGGGRSLAVGGGGNGKVDGFPGVSGGSSKSDDTSWICSDEVRSIPVMDIVDNSPSGAWTLHTKLPSSCCVDAAVVVSLPMTSNRSEQP